MEVFECPLDVNPNLFLSNTLGIFGPRVLCFVSGGDQATGGGEGRDRDAVGSPRGEARCAKQTNPKERRTKTESMRVRMSRQDRIYIYIDAPYIPYIYIEPHTHHMFQ